MKLVCKFKLKDLLPLCEKAMDQKEPNLHLVKDEGVYLMGRLGGDSKGDGNPVIYAENMTPEDGFFESDDFCDKLPVADFVKRALDGVTDVVITVTSTQLKVSWITQ